MKMNDLPVRNIKKICKMVNLKPEDVILKIDATSLVIEAIKRADVVNMCDYYEIIAFLILGSLQIPRKASFASKLAGIWISGVASFAVGELYKHKNRKEFEDIKTVSTFALNDLKRLEENIDKILEETNKSSEEIPES